MFGVDPDDVKKVVAQVADISAKQNVIIDQLETINARLVDLAEKLNGKAGSA